MKMQKVLFDSDDKGELHPSFSISKSIRNASYQNAKPRIGHEQQIVYTMLLQHPEGLTDHEIAELTGLSLSSVNGRRNELMHQKLVRSVGIATYNDNNSTLRLRTLWGAI
jgi:transcription initiation factor IIE alpha subunit